MDQIDLHDMRKKLYSYKKTGKKQVLSILTQLEDPKIDPKALAESKIHKTVRTLTNIELVGDAIMNEQDLKQIKEKASFTLAILDKVEKPSVLQMVSVPPQRKQSTEVKVAIPVQTSEIINSLGLPTNFDPTRLKVLQTLIEKFGVASVPQMQAAVFWKKLENEINSKYKDRQYQTSVKEMFKYLHNDKDNSVKTRLLTGLIDVPSAAMLKTEDWTSATRLSEAGGVGREILSANDMNHNKYIAQIINKDVALGLCNNCNHKQLKLINEIQTRASDEPSTKFYECLNCGVSETTNG